MQQLVPAAGGAGLRLKLGQQLRIIDPQGGGAPPRPLAYEILDK